jgi:hypothetical protein
MRWTISLIKSTILIISILTIHLLAISNITSGQVIHYHQPRNDPADRQERIRLGILVEDDSPKCQRLIHRCPTLFMTLNEIMALQPERKRDIQSLNKEEWFKRQREIDAEKEKKKQKNKAKPTRSNPHPSIKGYY